MGEVETESELRKLPCEPVGAMGRCERRLLHRQQPTTEADGDQGKDHYGTEQAVAVFREPPREKEQCTATKQPSRS